MGNKQRNIKKSDIWMVVAPIIILIICIFTKSGWLQTISSVSGVIYVILIAKENKYGYILGIINVIFYSILTWQKGLLGSAALNIIYSLPILIYGYIFWNKNQGKSKGNIKAMTKDNRVKLIVLFIVLVSAYYLIADNFFEIENVLVDSIIACGGLVGNILMARKFVEQWYVWLLVNSTNLIYWTINAIVDIEAIPLVAMWAIYVCNTSFGLISWNNKRKLYITNKM